MPSMRIVGWTAMLVVLGTARVATAVTNMINANTCEGEWTQVVVLPQVADRLVHWQALAPTCAKSGLYEVRLAAL
jgi:hypothetical protein